MKVVKDKAPSGRLAEVLSHPLRCRILVALTGRVASPNELCQELGTTLGDTSYHVRRLLGTGAIEFVHDRKVRGAVEHFYRATERPAVTAEEYAELSDPERRAYNEQLLQLFLADAALALDLGTMIARPDHYATRIPGQVDEQGWRDLFGLHSEAEARALEILGESANRVAKSGEASIPIVSVLTFFELPAPTRNQAAASDQVTQPLDGPPAVGDAIS